MANADGSVIFSCDLDSTKAQKKLSKLRDEIPARAYQQRPQRAAVGWRRRT